LGRGFGPFCPSDPLKKQPAEAGCYKRLNAWPECAVGAFNGSRWGV